METICVGCGVTNLNFGTATVVPDDFVSPQVGIAGNSSDSVGRSSRNQLLESGIAVSSCDEAGEPAGTTASPSHLLPAGCPENLQELASLFSSIATNAQVLQWKLPAYSHLKRPLREIERKAQRGGALLSGLMRSFGSTEPLIEAEAEFAESPTETKTATGANGRSVMNQAQARSRSHPSSQRHVTPALARVSQKGMIVVGTGTACR